MEGARRRYSLRQKQMCTECEGQEMEYCVVIFMYLLDGIDSLNTVLWGEEAVSSFGLHSAPGMSDFGPKEARLTPNGTDPGLFPIIV